MRKILLFLALFFITTQAQATEIVIQKNVAYTVKFPMVKNDGSFITGAAGLDSEISTRDAAGSWQAFTDCTNEASEDGSTGTYTLVIAQAETNHEWFDVQVKSSTTGAVTQYLKFRTTVGNPSLMATTDDGGTINVTGGAVDTVTTATTATNLTNAPTNGDLTATMKTSVATATQSGLTSQGYTTTRAPYLDKCNSLTFTTANQVDARVLTNSDKTGYTASTVSDKTGYSLTQAFPANFANLSISATTGLVDITQTAADKVWGTSARVLTAGTNIVLAKGTGITGFNDLDAAGIAGAVWNAATASYGTANTYGALIETNLDAAISTRGTSTLTAANVWNTNISAYSGAGYAGTYLKGIYDKLPAGTIGTSTYAGADTAGTTTLVGLLTAARAGYLDKLNVTGTLANTDNANSFKATGFSTHSAADVAALILATPANKLATDASGRVTVGSNADKAGYTISGTKTTLDSLNDITAASVWGVATRTLTAGAYSGLTEADIDAIWNELQSGHTTTGSFGKYLDAQVSTVGGGTAADIADAVWNEVMSGHITTGTAGKYLLDAQAAGNPWDTDISTGYTGKAGEVVRRIDKNTKMIR